MERPTSITSRLWDRLQGAGPDETIDFRTRLHWTSVRTHAENGEELILAPGEQLQRYLRLHGHDAAEDILLLRTYHCTASPALAIALADESYVQCLMDCERTQ